MYRLIVMNGCRVLQKYDQEWKTTGSIKKVEGDIKPGIYNLFLSESVQKNQSYEGLLLFVDRNENIIYQIIGDGYVKHDARFFGKKTAHWQDCNNTISRRIRSANYQGLDELFI